MAIQGDRIGDLTEVMSAAAGDWIEIERAADGLSRKISKDNLVGGMASVIGGGTINTDGHSVIIPDSGTLVLGAGEAGRIAQWADANTVEESTLVKSGAGVLTLSASGAFTLTIPATGTAALLAIANVFTANQRINALVGVNKSPSSDAQIDILSGAVNATPLRLTAIVSQTAPMAIMRDANSSAIMGFVGTATTFDRSIAMTMSDFDNGSSHGPRIFMGRNNNGSTPAAGHVMMTNLGNVIYRIWPDASGILRIHNASPTNANDTAGTVVGSQSSAAAAKDIDDTLPDWRESINYIVEAVQGGALRSWKYKSGAYNGEHYPIGIVTDFAERYGQDKNRSLNIPVAIGDLMGAVAMLAERVVELEGNNG